MMEVARTLRFDLLVKLLLAVLLGGIIGFEREIAGKTAIRFLSSQHPRT
jgi:uncharacterized membrane protein YhiD involved in acid resistance